MVRGMWLRTLALAAALCAGCNLVFGISGGSLPGTGGGTSQGTGGSKPQGTGGSSPAGTGGGTGGTGGAQATLSIAPSSTTVLSLASVQLTATLGGSAATVTWKVVGTGGGTVTPAGVYTAPASAGMVKVQATTVATPVQTATATLDIVSVVHAVPISTTGELSTATGHGTQSHLAYAQGTGQWWLFDDDSAAKSITTLVSDDFSTWKPAMSLTLPGGTTGDGRDLTVAYRELGGHDIVHISQGFAASSGGYGRYHVRAPLAHDQITFGAVNTVNPGGNLGGNQSPDGTSTIILTNGLVIDTTGYQDTNSLMPPQGLVTSGNCGHGDVDVYTSSAMDDGAAGFDAATWSPGVLWCSQGHVQARKLLQLGDLVVLLYADGGVAGTSTPNTNVLMDYRQSTGFWFPPEGGAAITPPSVFATNVAMDIDDWTAAIQGATVHAVRRTGPTAFEHRVMTTPSASAPWSNGGVIPAPQGGTRVGTGLFLAPYGPGLVLVTVSTDAGSILYTTFDGTAWAPAWATLSLISGGASFLSGFAPEDGTRPAVIWTEPAGQSYAIWGLQLP